MIVTDASVWVSLLTPQDLYHLASRRWFAGWQRQGGRIAAPVLLLGELAGAVGRRTGQIELAERVVEDILADPRVSLIAIDQDLGIATARAALRYRLRGADAAYVAVAQRLGLPLVTWDREQLERARVVVSTFTPETAPVGPP